LLYGIHLWADLDRDRLVGGSRPNQKDCFFSVIIVTHPKSYIETTDRQDFAANRQIWSWGRGLSWKTQEFCGVVGARHKNSLFRLLGSPSTILRLAYRKQFYPKPRVPVERRDSEGVHFASLESVTRHLADIGPEWCRIVVTWPSWKLKICIQAHEEKFTNSKNAIIFDLRRKVTKLSWKTVSEQWRHQALVAFSAHHSSRMKHRSRIVSYFFDLQSCRTRHRHVSSFPHTRLACRVWGNALEKFAVKFAKIRIWIGRNRTSDDVHLFGRL